MADPCEMTPILSKNRRYSRKLGPLETMYHTYNCREMDVCPLLFKLSTKSPVLGHHIRKALSYLVDEFASLRLSLVQTGRFEYKFVERERIPISIREVSAESFQSVLNKGCHHRFNFQDEPLWTFTWVRSKRSDQHSLEFPHTFQFFFIFHHAVCDFHQGRSIVQSFIRNITLAQGHPLPIKLNYHPFGPSIEQVLPLSLVARNINAVQNRQYDSSALDAYKSTFTSEIVSLERKKLSTEFIKVSLDEQETRSLMSQCRQNHVKITSAITAALSMAFFRLVRGKIPMYSKTFVVPVEIMVDLTRYIIDDKIKKSLKSVSAIHTPFLVNFDISDFQTLQDFWIIAKRIQANLDHALSVGAPMKVLLEDVYSEICNPPASGKSPFVLGLSNVGNLDDIVPEACRSEVRVADFIPWTNVTIDDMPIFITSVHTLNKSLVSSIGYCNGYTSNHTADIFAQHVSHILKSSSKL